MPADGGHDEEEAPAPQPASPAAASHQGSGGAASALEAFLDSAAQPTSRQVQHAQSYSRCATLVQALSH